VPAAAAPDAVSRIRARYGSPLTGYFGPYHEPYASLLAPVLERLPGPVLLIGRGGDRFAGPSSRVAATGSLPLADLSCHIAACDVMLHLYPDGVDTRRSTAMASLAHGRALVTTEGRFTESVWRESGAVILVPPGHPDAAAAAVIRLLEDEPERQRLGEAARRLHAGRFDIVHTVRSICESS
jgi:glycosyltransferase involved in cell wall biosynthesis